MPFTPFHFGPGFLIKSVAPRVFGLVPFIFVNVVIDFETLYFLVSHQYPYHRLFHTYYGVLIPIIFSSVLLFILSRTFLDKLFQGKLPDDFSRKSIVIGVLIGGFSHVVLDSIMHKDVFPFMPFDDNNGLYQIISLGSLHALCFVCGMIGGGILMVRFIKLKMFPGNVR